MIVKVFSAITLGIESQIVPIEIHSEPAPNFTLSVLGLSEYFGQQMKKRIEIAYKSNGIEMPTVKITINLGRFQGDKNDIMILDLPISVGILKAIGTLDWPASKLENSVMVGELGLDGYLRPIKGCLSIAIQTCLIQKPYLYIPYGNSKEVELIDGLDISAVTSLNQIINNQPLTKIKHREIAAQRRKNSLDYGDVKGQIAAKRAMQIAAAGSHNIIFMGPPGSGKTMLAERITSIMPELTYNEMLETSRIYSSLGTHHDLVIERPMRSPHHSTSLAGMIGGGVVNPAPGEISLSNNGILFLDEFTEFKPLVLEALRQPLESHMVTLIRRGISVQYPANFLLVAAFNPCPCGFSGDSKKSCTCSRQMVAHYLSKISGPILDRIDLQISLRSVEYDQINNESNQLDSETMFSNVKNALDMQYNRYKNTNQRNGTISIQDITQYCVLNSEAEDLMKKAFDALNLSMRGYHKILRIARTIADLGGSDVIQPEHLKEALTYRSLDQALNKLKS